MAVVDMAKVLDGLRELADEQFQRTVWTGKHSDLVASFDECIATIFDDSGLDVHLDAGAGDEFTAEAEAGFRELSRVVARVDPTTGPRRFLRAAPLVEARRTAKRLLHLFGDDPDRPTLLVAHLYERFDRVLARLGEPPLDENTNFAPVPRFWGPWYREVELVKPGAAPFTFTLADDGFTIEHPLLPEMIEFPHDRLDGDAWGLDRALLDALTCRIHVDVRSRRAQLRAIAADGTVRFDRRLYANYKHLEHPHPPLQYEPAFSRPA